MAGEVADDVVEQLLAVRPAAIAEAKRLCPELLRAELVRLGDGTCGLVDPANPCCCGRLTGASEEAGILCREDLPLARHAREEVRVWIDPLAKQLDDIVAMGELYRFDRFAAPAALWDDLQERFPGLLAAG